MESFLEVVMKTIVYILKAGLLLWALLMISGGFAAVHQFVHRLFCRVFHKFSRKKLPAFLESGFDESIAITFAFVFYIFGNYAFGWDFLNAKELLDFITGTW